MVDALIRIALLAAIFGSVFVAVQISLNLAWSRRTYMREVNQRLRLLSRGLSREQVMIELRKNDVRLNPNLPYPIAKAFLMFERAVRGSAIAIAPTQLLLVMLVGFAAVLSLVLIATVLAGLVISSGTIVMATIFAGCLSIALPLMVLSTLAQRRRRKMAEQFPVSLDIFVRALKAGHPVAGAIELLTKEMEDPIGSEFGLVNDEISYGAALTESLAAMAERWDSDDMRMFVVSISVQNETGGNLAEILQNLADVIRARASLYMKVRALSSEGRMTGWMLTILPVATFVGMFLVNPAFYLSVASDSMFIIGAICLGFMYFCGFIMIRKMVDIKV
ncbi:MAG: type II secretion system F family protein [Pseudomonadota bacterium]